MDAHSPPLGAGKLVGRSLRLLFAQFGFLFPLAFVPSMALAALTWSVTPGLPPEGAPSSLGGLPQSGAGPLLVFTLSLLLGVAITGVTCLAALDAVLGKRHALGDYLRQTLRHMPALTVLSLLFGLAVGLGLLLLILPGLYIFARFLPYTQAVVFENAGWSGLGRAQDLTNGYRWPLVGASILIGLSLLAAALALSPVFAAASGSMALGVLADAAFSALATLLPATYGAHAYLRLREIKEGVSPAEIAATID